MARTGMSAERDSQEPSGSRARTERAGAAFACADADQDLCPDSRSLPGQEGGTEVAVGEQVRRPSASRAVKVVRRDSRD
jgi:hypothetical protein